VSWISLTVGVVLGSIASAILIYLMLVWLFKDMWR
jgi:hypothetical protein